MGQAKVLSMRHVEGTDGAPEIAFEAYGVPMVVAANRPELLDRVMPFLPPGARPCDPEAVKQRFAIFADPSGTYNVASEGKGLARGVELDLALELLDSQIRLYIGQMAPHAIFVHAGVVASGGKTIVLPGPSFAGKTTLVAALVGLGAIYYSDEFAVVDENGLVHPYAKSLSLRNDDLTQTDHPVDTLGGVAGEKPLPMGAVVVTRFRPGAQWQPRRLSAGEGALALLANAVPAQKRAEEAMRAVSRGVEGALVLEGERGEAGELAQELLAELGA